MSKYYLSLFIGALLTVIAQLLLKKGAMLKRKNIILDIISNKYVILGYLLFVTVTILNLYAFKEVPIIIMVVISPLIQILVVSFSVLIFKEKINNKQLKGFILIIVGIIIFNLNFQSLFG